MTAATKTPFPFPLGTADIAAFCHPSAGHPLSIPAMIDGNLHAGNGHIAIRALTGRWMESDFPACPPDIRARFEGLPWHRLPAHGAWWKPLDDIRGTIYASAPISPYTSRPDGRIVRTPSPVWEIGGHHLIRLSHLQLLARLPKASVYTGPADKGDPLFISYSNGLALIPMDAALTTSSRKLFPPTYHRLEGFRKEPSARPAPSWGKPPPPEPPLEGWPPPEPAD